MITLKSSRASKRGSSYPMKQEPNNTVAPVGHATEYCSECGTPKSCIITAALNAGIPTSLFFSTKGLLNAIDECTDPGGLLKLYDENKKRIDEIPELKQAFTNRKKWCN